MEAEGLPTIFLKKYKSNSVEQLIEFIKGESCVSHVIVNKLLGSSKCLYATGGGAHKYKELLKKELDVEIKDVDEMMAVKLGLTFVLQKVKNSIFNYLSDYEYYTGSIKDLWPFLIVNIGSGVSMIKASGPDTYQRVSGSMIGGGIIERNPCYRNSDGISEHVDRNHRL